MARKELLVMAAVAMGAGLALADNAVPRGGGSGGGSSSSGSSVGGGGSTSSTSSSGGSGGSYSPGSSSSSSGATHRTPSTPAQARQPRPGTGHGGSGGGGYYPGNPGYPGYGYPGYGYQWYPSYGWGYRPYWGYGGWDYWGFYDPYFYGYYGPIGGWSGGGGGGSRASSSEPVTVRLLSDPEDAQVFVDDRLVGAVADFDDMTQRLRLTSGSHEIVIRKAGYVAHRIRLYAESGEDIKIRHFLDKGTGETTESIGAPPPKLNLRISTDGVAPASAATSEGAAREERRRPGRDAEPEVEAEPATLTVHVDPDDASVYVDGRFKGTSDEVDELELPAGTHSVEVVRPGYRSVDLQVTLQAGKDKSVRVRLEKP